MTQTVITLWKKSISLDFDREVQIGWNFAESEISLLLTICEKISALSSNSRKNEAK